MYYDASSKDSEDRSYLIHAESQGPSGSELFSGSSLL